MFARRIVLSTPQAFLITFALFYFMQALIDTGEFVEQEISVIRIVDATIPPPEMEVVEEIDKPEPIEFVSDEIETPTKNISLSDGPNMYIAPVTPEMNSTVEIGISQISASDGDYIPLVNVTPSYPTRALSRGIEGWCLVEFTVDERGNVLEDSIVVVDSEPPNIFNRASIRAAARFKFQPRVESGLGVAVHNVPYIFRFEMEQ
ncbi:MAG: TonB family protein [Pseudomonadales bacterium]|nr:TonB family protein [Pseudomonadales bacterium]